MSNRSFEGSDARNYMVLAIRLGDSGSLEVCDMEDGGLEMLLQPRNIAWVVRALKQGGVGLVKVADLREHFCATSSMRRMSAFRLSKY